MKDINQYTFTVEVQQEKVKKNTIWKGDKCDFSCKEKNQIDEANEIKAQWLPGKIFNFKWFAAAHGWQTQDVKFFKCLNCNDLVSKHDTHVHLWRKVNGAAYAQY